MKNNQLLLNQLTSLLAGEPSPLAILANASALINQSVSQLNWAGFYLYDQANNELVLGPFQGQVACSLYAHQNGNWGLWNSGPNSNNAGGR